MSRKVTVTVVKALPGNAWRSDARWLPWRWVAFTEPGVMVAESRFHATRDDCIADIMMLFGDDTDITVNEPNATPWPTRTLAVPA